MSDARALKVLVVSLGRRGGVTEYGWLMGRALSRHCEVAVVCSEFAENRHKWDTLDVPVMSVKTFSNLRTVAASYLDVAKFARIGSFVREFAPDIIYYPGGHAWKPVFDAIFPQRTCVVLTVHDPELHSGEDSLLYRIHNAINRFKVDGYVLLNEAAREGFVTRNKLHIDQVEVVPHGVFDDYSTGHADIQPLPAEVEAVTGRYVLFVGRFLPYKGLATLLRAYLEPASAHLPLVIAGSGELTAEEESLLAQVQRSAETVYINRWLTDEEMASLVYHSRFVVLPYTSATQSGVIPLASAFGVPSIASDTGGLAEQVVDGQTGWLFPPGDSAALARVIAEVGEMDDERYSAVSAAVRHYAEENWSWDSLAARLVEFFGAVTRR